MITMTSDDSRNIGYHSRISTDASLSCANHTLRESSVKRPIALCIDFLSLVLTHKRNL